MAGRSWSGLSHPFMRPAGRPGVSLILDDRLWIGEYPTPDDVAWLRDEHGIGVLLSLQDEADLASKGVELRALEAACAAAEVALYRFPVVDGDSKDMARCLPAILEKLHALLEAKERVYLHCNAGFNRAPTVAIAYLHAHGGLSVAEAREVIRSKRACAPYMTAIAAVFGE